MWRIATNRREPSAFAHNSRIGWLISTACFGCRSWRFNQRIIGAALRPNSNPGHPAGRPVVAGFRAAWRGTTSTIAQRIPCGFRYARKLRVRNHPLDVRRVSRTHLDRLAQLPHSARRLRAKQMTLARMRAHNLACRSHSESLGCAAMRLQLSNFCFRFRHDCTFSENF
jgi:hypothetical protein